MPRDSKQRAGQKGSAVARNALEGLPNKVLAAEYRTALPKDRALVAEIEKTIHQFEVRRATGRIKAGRRSGLV